MKAAARPNRSIRSEAGFRTKKIPERASPVGFSHSENYGFLATTLLSLHKLPTERCLSRPIESVSIFNRVHGRSRKCLKSKMHRWLPKAPASRSAETEKSHRSFDMQQIHRHIEDAVPNRPAHEFIDIHHSHPIEAPDAVSLHRFRSLASEVNPANGHEDSISEELLLSTSRKGAIPLIGKARMQQIISKCPADPNRQPALDEIFSGESRHQGLSSKQSEDLLMRFQTHQHQSTAQQAPDLWALFGAAADAEEPETPCLGKRGGFEELMLSYRIASEDFSPKFELNDNPIDTISFEKSDEDLATTFYTDIIARTDLAANQ